LKANVLTYGPKKVHFEEKKVSKERSKTPVRNRDRAVVKREPKLSRELTKKAQEVQ